MVQVTQTDEEIKVTIELNRLITRKPDIVLLPTYIKFNNPPIFFERHLVQEIDEMSSFCRIYKNEARLVLVKKQKGIWPELFQKYSKEELMQKRLEIADQLVERNKERDKIAIERYENKRRAEISKEVQRETAMRDRVKQFEENACREALRAENRRESSGVLGKQQTIDQQANADGFRDGIVGTQVQVRSQASIQNNASAGNSSRVGTPIAPLRAALSAVRGAGKINVNFSSFAYVTPKRESQEGKPRPFVVENAPKREDSSLATVKE